MVSKFFSFFAALLVFSIAFFPSIAFSQSTAAKCGVASLTTSEDCNGAGYKKAGWTCYDDSSSSERDENCKSYEDWKAKATSYCEGKCEPATAECTDSDNGKDVYTYGKATGGDGHTRYDVCLSDSNLFEAYCPTPTHPHSDYASIICPDGTTCSGGVCVKKDQCSWGEWRSYQCSSQCGNLKEACKQGYYCQERKDSCGNLEGRCLYSPDCDKSCDITSKSLGSCSPTECGDRKCDSGQRCVKYLDSCGKTSYDCVYDSDCAGSEVKEEVKCVFQGATSGSSGKCGVNSFEVVSECENGFRRASWSCYDGTTSVQGGDSSCKPSSTWRQYAEEFCKGLCSGETQSHECYSEKGKCTGVGSCVVDVVGKRGEEVVWKSSCGGYAYTYVDGESEHAVFDCAPQACYTTSKSAGGCGPIECGDRKCDSGEQCLKYYDSCGATAYSCVSTRDCLEKGFCGDGVCTSEESREVCSTYCEAGIGSVPGKCYTNCFTGCDSDCRPKEICGDGVCQESEKSCKTSCAQAVVRGGFDEEAIKSQTEQCESYCSTNCPRDCDIEKRYCGDGVCEDYEKQKVCEASACPPCPAGADCSPCAPPVCESYCRVDCRDDLAGSLHVWTQNFEYYYGNPVELYAKVVDSDGSPATPEEGTAVYYNGSWDSTEMLRLMAFDSSLGYYVSRIESIQPGTYSASVTARFSSGFTASGETKFRVHQKDKDYCGDGVCSSLESGQICETCPACAEGEACKPCGGCRVVCPEDCGGRKYEYCGDGVCSGYEAVTCPARALPVTPTATEASVETQTRSGFPAPATATTATGFKGGTAFALDCVECPRDCKTDSYCGDGVCTAEEENVYCKEDCREVNGVRDCEKVCTTSCQPDCRFSLTPEPSPEGREKCRGLGCYFNGTCLPVGNRVADSEKKLYCGAGGEFEAQLDLEAPCQNSYECESNFCSSGKCLDIEKRLERTENLLEQILGFLRRLFGLS